jgi:hypothetical protein
MTLRLSKILLALEAIVIVAPITFLFSMIAMDMFMSALRFDENWLLAPLVTLITLVSLAAGWQLMVSFWRHGPDRLRASSRFLWTAVVIGAAATLFSVTLLAIGALSHWSLTLGQPLWAMSAGLPLLLPFGHLLAERRRGK